MDKRSFVTALLAAAALPRSAHAQVYPTQTIRLVVPFAAGGAADVIGRFIAERMSGILKRTVTVENRPGRGGAVATEEVSRAAPDGYTLLYASNGTLVTNPIFLRTPGYDPLRSLVPISLVSFMPMTVAVNPKIPARTLSELLTLVKDAPGRYRYATAGVGTLSFLSGELFKSVTGLDVRDIAFKGPNAAIQAVIAGEADILFEAGVFLPPKVDDGQLRALAIMGPVRYPQLEGVPTTAEAGLPELTAYHWGGLMAPHGTPVETIDVLNGAVRAVLAEMETMATFQKSGTHAEGSTPQQFHRLIRAELTKWSQAIPLSAITPQ